MKIHSNPFNISSRKLLIILAIAILHGSVFAQAVKKDTAMNRTVIVENEYNPDIMDASKINMLPEIEEPTITKKDIDYSTTETPASSFGNYQAMPSLANKPMQAGTERGYARLGYGNYGNVDIKLNYLFALSAKAELAFSGSFGGMNGTLKLDPPYGVNIKTVDWKSHFYSTVLNLNYSHLFKKLRMDIAGNLGVDNFNYHQVPVLQFDNSWMYQPDFADKQNQTKGSFRTILTSTDETLPLQFKAEAGYSYFKKKYDFGEKIPNNEQIISLNADMWGSINDYQKVGLKVDLNGFLYSSNGLSNYTSLQTNPYYTLDGDNWKLRIGAHVDFSFGKGNMVKAAPDINIQYVFADNYVLYLKADGGSILNDYRQLENTNPYWAIYNSGWWKNTHMPLDLSLGLKASPFSGFRFNIFAGYQLRNNDLCFSSFLPEYSSYAYSYVQTASTKAFYSGIELNYIYKDILNISTKGTYYKWNNEKNELLLTKPKMTVNVNADIKVLPFLYANLGYELVTRPEVTLNRINNLPAGEPYNFKMDPINNLSMGVTYNFWKGLSAYLKLNNILNRNYQYYYSYPAEKLNFLAGFSAKF